MKSWNRYTWKRHVHAILERMSENGLLLRAPNSLVGLTPTAETGTRSQCVE